MPDSKKRQRKREKPLKELRRAIEADFDRAASDHHAEADPAMRKRICGEVFKLSDPLLPGFHEAALPSYRGDLRRDFIRRRLDGEGEGEDLWRLAREYMPIPDGWAPSGRFTIGHPPGPSYDNTWRAFRSLRSRMGF